MYTNYRGFRIYKDFLSLVAYNKATGKVYRAHKIEYLCYQIDHNL